MAYKFTKIINLLITFTLYKIIKINTKIKTFYMYINGNSHIKNLRLCDIKGSKIK